MKPCSKCLEIKPYDHFYRSTGKTCGYASQCKVCWKSTNRTPAFYASRNRIERARENTPEKKLKRVRCRFAYYIRYMHGLEVIDWALMYEIQDGKCAICSCSIAEGTEVHVDHNHATGVVRGLLCGRCNSGLGLFLESPAALRSAAAYAERHSLNDVKP